MLTARTFTYASPALPRLQRLVIGGIEQLTGRLKIWRLYCEYRAEAPLTGESFWSAALRKLCLRLDFDPACLDAIPTTGPLVVVANHPFGVIDGIAITYLLEKVRGDFRVLTNSALCKAPEAAGQLLAVDFSGTAEALQTNLETRRAARAILRSGGCIAVFPAGGVSTITGWGDRVAQDNEWQPFIARLILESRAVVVPVFFAGQNSALFQWLSLLSPTLRLSLFLREVVRRIGGTISVKIGAPIPFEALAPITDRAALCRELRARTYALGGLSDLPPPRPAYRLGE